MKEKWNREQIEFAKKILRDGGCGNVYYSCEHENCPWDDYECPFKNKKNKEPSYRYFDKSSEEIVTKLLQQHEHDCDTVASQNFVEKHFYKNSDGLIVLCIDPRDGDNMFEGVNINFLMEYTAPSMMMEKSEFHPVLLSIEEVKA